MTEVTWEDPPLGRNKHGRWILALSPLVSQPGRWARITTKPNASAASGLAAALSRGSRLPGTVVKRNNWVTVPPGRWEFCSRTIKGAPDEPVQYVVYGRYLGPQE